MFNPIDFLDLAKELTGGNEAKLRTSISRAYYASFMFLRDIMRIADKTPEVHKNVVCALYHKNPIIANKLHLLRRQRNLADYNTHFVINKENAKNAVKLADEIIESYFH